MVLLVVFNFTHQILFVIFFQKMAPGSTLRSGVNEEGGHKESPDADTTKALKAFFRPLSLTLRFIYTTL